MNITYRRVAAAGIRTSKVWHWVNG